MLRAAFAFFIIGATLAASPALAAEPKPMSEKIGARVSRGAIEESLETLDAPENRARLGRIVNSAEMRDAMHDLTASIVMGAFDGVREARANKGPSTTGRSIRDGIDKQITPAIGRMTYRIVDSALSAALADKRIEQIDELAEGTSRAVIRGVANGLEHDLGPALAATIDKDIGPAIAVMLSRDVLPAVGRGLDSPEMQSAIANISRSIATEFVGGAGDAMDVETEQNKAEGKESGLQLFGNKVAFGYAIALFVSFAFGTMLIVLTVLLLRTNRRQRRQSEDAKRREAALLHLVDTIETDYPALKTDMRRLVREQIETEP